MTVSKAPTRALTLLFFFSNSLLLVSSITLLLICVSFFFPCITAGFLNVITVGDSTPFSSMTFLSSLTVAVLSSAIAVLFPSDTQEFGSATEASFSSVAALVVSISHGSTCGSSLISAAGFSSELCKSSLLPLLSRIIILDDFHNFFRNDVIGIVGLLISCRAIVGSFFLGTALPGILPLTDGRFPPLLRLLVALSPEFTGFEDTVARGMEEEVFDALSLTVLVTGDL
ncbi:hypothetical protein MUK42_11827 [Musa troglodytarum]|uniref:Uncharacterized protein n=1 Tax=Musa troglodytarum TaxID=320322 RepID=A0A9E7GQX3_9LILI|nr:hypothetical protein MUK42_11827 [Musa troglodytarum]